MLAVSAVLQTSSLLASVALLSTDPPCQGGWNLQKEKLGANGGGRCLAKGPYFTISGPLGAGPGSKRLGLRSPLHSPKVPAQRTRVKSLSFGSSSLLLQNLRPTPASPCPWEPGDASAENVSNSDPVTQVRVGGADGSKGSGLRVDPVGALARPRPARPRRGRRALPGGGGGDSGSIRGISILGSSRGRPRAGPAGQTDRGCQGRGAAGASHGGCLVRRGPRGGRPGPRELCAAAPDPAAGRVLGVLHRGVRPHCQRGLRECRQRPRTALRLQRERGCLSLRRRAGSRGLLCLRRVPAARRALPADQQRPRPPPRSAAGPGLLRALGLPVVRGFLLPHQSVAAHCARAGHGAGGGRGAGRHRLQLLLHPQLGGAHGEGPAAVPPGHRHVALRHRTAGLWGRPGLPRLPGGQRCGGHRDLPEPALHRDLGNQSQRVPGARLLVSDKRGPGLEGHPTNTGPKASWDLSGVLEAQHQGQQGWPLWASGARRG